MRIKTLRASGSTLLAEVAVGSDDKSNDVTLHLRIDRLRNEALATALEPLEALLVAEAEERINQAVKNATKRRRAA